ncbi:recombinase family protein [Microbacterium sp. No. 7]|uniref:recombinase family protein n=1 Tax=Microbacterium sp. No. 7 TaxID=1714373 RepID=UPI0006D2273B|nr:recombinase family protein [Microbacterium sp. No. 7]ALJ20310.1 hypothetical protein AOA12_10460 [Microbacterium sp. No. 7]
MTKRAALYLRQSKADDEGIDRQEERTRSLAAARGWTVAATFTDNDISASKPRGAATAWGRMLAMADRLDVVVAVDLDRIARSTRDLNTLIDHGLALVTVDGEIDLASADGELRASVLASVARFEVRRKSERQVRANSHRAAAGHWVGGRRPFGFEADGVTVRPAEADAVRQGFRDILTGIPLAAVARSWNEQGFVTGQQRQARSGHAGEPSPWTAQSVRLVLTNPRYVGLVRYRGEIMSTPAKWPAIVDDATYQGVQAILSDPSRRKPGRRPQALLTGLAVCGVAGCEATVHGGANTAQRLRTYRCRGSLGHISRKADPIDEFVEAVIVARLARPDARQLLAAPSTVDTTALHIEAVAIRERLAALAADFADGLLSRAQMLAGTERANARLAELDVALADAGKVDKLGELIAADDVREVWDGYSTDRRREIIRELARVVVHPVGRGTRTFRPESVVIDWLS